MMSRQIPRVGQQRCRLHKTKYSDVTLSSNLSWNYPVQFSCVFCCSRGSHNCGPVWVQCRSNPEWQGNDGVMYRSEYIHTHTHTPVSGVCGCVKSHSCRKLSCVLSNPQFTSWGSGTFKHTVFFPWFSLLLLTLLHVLSLTWRKIFMEGSSTSFIKCYDLLSLDRFKLVLTFNHYLMWFLFFSLSKLMFYCLLMVSTGCAEIVGWLLDIVDQHCHVSKQTNLASIFEIFSSLFAIIWIFSYYNIGFFLHLSVGVT